MPSRRKIVPSFSQGFARNRAQSRYPSLWDGLVGLWAPSLGPQGPTLFDFSGYANHGTLNNMNNDDWVPGRIGYGLLFDGSNDYVGGITLPDLSRGATWMAWSNLLASGSNPIVMSSKVASNFWEIRYGVSTGSDQKPNFLWNFSGITNIGSSSAVTLGQWNHLCMTVTAAGAMVAFVNGLQIGTASGTYGTTALTLYIGSLLGTSQFGNLVVDDVRVYNRPLDPTEVALSASGGSPLDLKIKVFGKSPLQTATPGLATVAVEGQSPAASATGTASAVPGVATVTVAGQSPAASGSGALTVTPGLATVAVDAQDVTATLVVQTATPGLATVVVAAQDVTATTTIPTQTATPGAATITVAAQAPAASGSGTGTATPGMAIINITAQTVSVSGGISEGGGGWMRSLSQRYRKLRRRHGRRVQ